MNKTTRPTGQKVKAKPSKKRGLIPLPTTDVLGRDLVGEAASLSLPLDGLEPDPNQARWILPPEIRGRFISGELTAAQALERWRKLVERQTARSKEPVSDEPPEARKLKEIEALARSIKSGGQVNPITVCRQGDRWRIETGERRYWAHVYLVHVLDDKEAERVPAVVTPKVDVFRQAVENLHASPLNAVALAREVARLLTALESKNPAPGQDLAVMDLAAYREVAGRRVPHKGWERIVEAMGKTADHLARHLRLLSLPDEAILIADRSDLTEKQLRPVTELQEAEAQTRIVRLAAELKLSSADVEWLCRQPDLDEAEKELRARLLGKELEKTPRARYDPEEILYKRVVNFRRFVESVKRGGGQPAQALAKRFVADKGEAAKGELQDLIDLLQAAAEEIDRAQTGDTEAGIPAPGQEV